MAKSVLVTLSCIHRESYDIRCGEAERSSGWSSFCSASIVMDKAVPRKARASAPSRVVIRGNIGFVKIVPRPVLHAALYRGLSN